MKDLSLKIRDIEKEIREIPYHKGTEHYIGRLKAKLAKLRRQETQQRKSGSRLGFIPKKAGDATVVLFGPPSVGKSALLNKLSGARSRVEPWPFTTLKVIPGMLKYKGAYIQILDLPGIISGAHLGIGRGREVFSAARIADLLLLVVEYKKRKKIGLILKEFKKLRITVPILTVINKSDLADKPLQKTKKNQIFVSAKTGFNLEKIKEIIWQNLKLMRIYLKPKGDQPDFSEPLILKKEETVAVVAKKLFPTGKAFKQVVLWGPSACFPGQQVSLNHSLKDEDILTFI
ncbi:MAG TPA: GTPase [Nevskiaceae bacterium]|nr:GTPase [Nevskiaceae bacterium]